MQVKLEDYQNDVEIAWCPGCGNFPILKAVQETLVELNLPPHRVVICSGIGQAPKLPHYMRVNTFNGLHGREVASATAVKMASPELTVLVHAGDGGAYGEGGNHFLHAMRRNVDITLVVHDNKYYSLTKGQVSPTGDTNETDQLKGFGLPAPALNPLTLAISQNCSLVAQATSAKPDHLVKTLKTAITHPGFSLVNVLQPCVVWDKKHTYSYYKKQCYEIEPSHDPENFEHAMRLAISKTDQHPIGILYRSKRLAYQPILKNAHFQPLRDRGINPESVVKLMDKFH